MSSLFIAVELGVCFQLTNGVNHHALEGENEGCVTLGWIRWILPFTTMLRRTISSRQALPRHCQSPWLVMAFERSGWRSLANPLTTSSIKYFDAGAAAAARPWLSAES
jgi:hypothetical protein